MLYAMNFSAVADIQATADLLVPELQSIIDAYVYADGIDGIVSSYVHFDSNIKVKFFKRFITEADAIAAKASIVSKLAEIPYLLTITSPSYLGHPCDRPNSQCPAPEVMA